MRLFAESPAILTHTLTETYRPLIVSGFIGLETPKQRMQTLIARPKESAWLFVGPSGLGKTTLAMAVAEELNAEIYHIPSQRCTIDEVGRCRSRCQHMPTFGKRLHLVLVDEADTMSQAAQDAFLSILDSTNRAPGTVFIFTCNGVERLQDRFISRCFQVKFSSQAMAPKIAAYLEDIWNKETNNNPNRPLFNRIATNAHNNVRTALNELEMEIDAALAGIPRGVTTDAD